MNALKLHDIAKSTEVVFNLGELGSADSGDRKVKKVVASAAVAMEDVYHSVFRGPHDITLLACVSAAGDAMTSLFITAALIPDSLWRRGLRQNEDVIVRQRSPGYVDGELFFE
jgi:hypothetical protein